jgi:hypothetical protein
MRELSNTPKIVFVGFDDKPVDLVQTMFKKSKLSPKEQALQDYFKSLYTVGESKQ